MSENVVPLKTDAAKDERPLAATEMAAAGKPAANEIPPAIKTHELIAENDAKLRFSQVITDPLNSAADEEHAFPQRPLRKSEARRITRSLRQLANGTPRWVSSIEEARILILNIGTILALLLGGPILYKLITRDALVISEISVPEGLSDRGLSGPVLTQRLYDEIVSVSRFTNGQVEKSEVLSTPLEANLPTLELPIGGVNLGALLNSVRSFFGVRDRKISGEIVIEQEKDEEAKKPEKYSLRLRAAGEGQIYRSAGMSESIDTLLREAAIVVLQRNDPVVAAYYYLLRRDYKNAQRMAEIASVSGDPKTRLNATYLKALKARGLNDWREAAKLFQDVIRANPDFRAGWAQLASVTRRFDLAETEKIANQMIEKFPDYWPSYNNLALVRLLQRKGPEAVELMRKAEDIAPASPELHYQKTFILRAVGQYEDSLAALEKAQLLNPTAIHYLIQAEIIMRDMGNYKGALASGEKIIAIEPTNAEGYVVAARALIGLKDFKRADEMLRKALAIDANFAPALTNLGRLNALKRNLREAVTQFDRALAADPRHYETQEFRADMLVEQKKPEEALPLYLKAIEYGTFPGWLASHPRAKAGKIYEAKGVYMEAIDLYERAMRSDPRAYASLKANIDQMKAKVEAATAPASSTAPVAPK